jgi:uncharacterized membrane protein
MYDNPMQTPQRSPTAVYAACSVVLGIIALISALVWHYSIGHASVSGATPAGNIISGILGFLGFLLLLWSVLYFITVFIRRQSGHEEESVIPDQVLSSRPDTSLQKPHDEAILDVPLDSPNDSKKDPQTKPLLR